MVHQLRRVTTLGANATTLHEYGPASSPNNIIEPIGAYGLAYSPSPPSLSLATGQDILRTTLDGGSADVAVPDVPDLHSVTVTEWSGKIYYGTMLDGFIRRANFDGTGIKVFRNVSQGIDWSPAQYFEYANSYADGILVNEKAAGCIGVRQGAR